MVFLLALALHMHIVSASPLDEQAPPPTNCDPLMQPIFDRSDTRSVYFDRWNLQRGLASDAVLADLITEQSSRRPVVILDTNPSPTRWISSNIFTAEADISEPDTTYSQLTDPQKHRLYVDFVHRVAEQPQNSTVIFFDHHFDSHLLLDASTTPMVVDFLLWLTDQTGSASETVRAVLRQAIVLRDHSDADIVLSNFALGLLDRPEELRRWASLLKGIALYNDHLYLAPDLNAQQRMEIVSGYELMLALEKWIPQHIPGGFAQALEWVPDVLQSVQRAAESSVVWSADVLPDWIEHWKQWAPPSNPKFHELLSVLENNWSVRQEFRKLVAHADFATFDEILVVRFIPLKGPKISTVDLIRYLLAQRSDLLTGIKVVVAVSSKEGHQGVYHLKIRAMSSETDLTSIFHQNVAKGYPGGGRAGAGSFTWDFSADQQTSEARLENELSQLMTAIHQLKQ